jgi:hypothetical protein
MSRLNATIAAHAHARQTKLIRKADAAAGRIDQLVRRLWRDFLARLKSGQSWHILGPWLRQQLTHLPVALHNSTVESLAHVVAWSYGSTRRSLVETIPEHALQQATPTRLHESRNNSGDNFSEFLKILFPPLTPHQVDSVLFAGDWRQRLAAATKLADPNRLAQTLSTGLIFGKSHQQIAREILPLMQGVLSSAKRVARTECMRVADRAQMACHEQLGDLVIGYQIHSAHSPNSRSWHVRRDGTIYYVHPQPGQKGLRQMPNPPDEAEDSAERPPGTPKTAWNCLCYRTPVLRPETTAQPAPAAQTPAHAVTLPDGQTVEFTRHEASPKSEVLVMIDPRRLDPAWQQDVGFYLPTGSVGETEVAGRREGVKEFLKKKRPVQASRVELDRHGRVFFRDGRHRFAVLRDQGAERVGVMVPRRQEKKFKEQFA